jgi:hypothetical protein
MTATQDAHPAVARAAPAARPEFGEFFLARFLGLDISYHDQARTCTVVLPYAAHLCNPQGSMHGGVITTAMDVSMGHLCHRFLSTAVTIEMNLRPRGWSRSDGAAPPTGQSRPRQTRAPRPRDVGDPASRAPGPPLPLTRDPNSEVPAIVDPLRGVVPVPAPALWPAGHGGDGGCDDETPHHDRDQETRKAKRLGN